jgi:hypothetical protein
MDVGKREASTATPRPDGSGSQRPTGNQRRDKPAQRSSLEPVCKGSGGRKHEGCPGEASGDSGSDCKGSDRTSGQGIGRTAEEIASRRQAAVKRVGEGDRTLGHWSHNPALYQLSYAHRVDAKVYRTPSGKRRAADLGSLGTDSEFCSSNSESVPKLPRSAAYFFTSTRS